VSKGYIKVEVEVKRREVQLKRLLVMEALIYVQNQGFLRFLKNDRRRGCTRYEN